MDSDDENSSIFQNLNTKINVKIEKTYINEMNYINKEQFIALAEPLLKSGYGENLMKL